VPSKERYPIGEAMALVLSGGLYVGEHRIRVAGGRAYLHIPVKAVEGFGSRKVKVVARVNAVKCEDRNIHGSILSFPATLVNAGGTYRVNLPSYYYTLALKIASCGSLEVWLAPRG
jgi:hypothetical protein